MYSLDLSLSFFLSGFFSPLIICFFFFTKITEQHQHLFLLKPTLSSAGRPTKTEADHFLFLSFTRMHAPNTCTQHTQKTHTHTRTKVYIHPLALVSALARVSLSRFVWQNRCIAFCPAPPFLRFIKYPLFFLPCYMKRIIGRIF